LRAQGGSGIADTIQQLVRHPEIVRALAAFDGCPHGELCGAHKEGRLRDNAEIVLEYRLTCDHCGDPSQWLEAICPRGEVVCGARVKRRYIVDDVRRREMAYECGERRTELLDEPF
jgi:hypothetical protein